MSERNRHDDAAVRPALRDYWLAECLRLRETRWGPLEDAQEVRQLQGRPQPLEHLLLMRARLLGRREGLDTVIAQWRAHARLALLILFLAALLAGAGAALGVLGSGARPVNLMTALSALLGLHSLSLLLWCLTPLLPRADTQAASLGELWLWLSRRLARGPDRLLALQGLVSLLGRQGRLRSVLSSISHAWWLLALGTTLVTLLALLSTRRYDFVWETTLLSPDTMAWLAQSLGWLPAQLGFALPDADVIRISDGLHTLPEGSAALWSQWLLGCLICYGVLPRLAALAFSLTQAVRGLHRLRIDPGLPGFAELRERLQAHSQPGGIDAPASAPEPALAPVTPADPGDETGAAIAGLELGANTPWPPEGLTGGVQDLGVVDSRAQRQALLQRLDTRVPTRLLLVCDGRQMPDRGTVAWLGALARTAPELRLGLLGAPLPDARQQAWREAIVRAGLAREALFAGLPDGLAWLTALPATPESMNA